MELKTKGAKGVHDDTGTYVNLTLIDEAGGKHNLHLEVNQIYNDEVGSLVKQLHKRAEEAIQKRELTIAW